MNYLNWFQIYEKILVFIYHFVKFLSIFFQLLNLKFRI